MNTCISIQSIIDNWHIVLPMALFGLSEVMGLMPNTKAKGLSHFILLMYQNSKTPASVTYVAPPPPSPPAETPKP